MYLVVDTKRRGRKTSEKRMAEILFPNLIKPNPTNPRVPMTPPKINYAKAQYNEIVENQP